MPRRRTIPGARPGFTLVELLLAGVVAAFVLGSITMTLSQLGRAKNSSKVRFDAHLRADAALNAMRRDIISVTRTDDLFYTRLLIIDDSVRLRDEQLDRDEILVFNTRLRPLHDIDFNGEGFEYETQFRVADDELGPVLWQRRDPMPDEFSLGGGVATPLVEGVLSLQLAAYSVRDQAWYDSWDSDLDGLPDAVSITVIASGHRGEDDVYTAPRALLRTIVPIDRVLMPKDLFKSPEEEAQEDAAAEEEMTDEEAGTDGGLQGTGATGGAGRPGRGSDGGGRGAPGGRPGDGRPGDRPGRPGRTGNVGPQ